MPGEDIVSTYLDLLDSQREAAFAALEGLSEDQLWLRPAPKEWCLGELLEHNYLLMTSSLPYVEFAWKVGRRRAERRRDLPYATAIEDPYRQATFPMWVGFLWRPRYNPSRRRPLADLLAENRGLHARVRAFYTGKDPDLLGQVAIYDPLFHWVNLIVTLRIGIYHDQLHFDDLIKRAEGMKLA
jgi:hypothetical protein